MFSSYTIAVVISNLDTNKKNPDSALGGIGILRRFLIFFNSRIRSHCRPMFCDGPGGIFSHWRDTVAGTTFFFVTLL